MKKLGFVVATVLGIGLASPAVAQGPVLTLTVGKGSGLQGPTTTVLYGELVRVVGKISSGAANEPLRLFVDPRAGSARTVDLRTDSSGAFRYLHRPTSNTRYLAHYGGQSEEASAFVRLKVRLRLVSASSRHGTFRITTPAGPAPRGWRVVWFQRLVTKAGWETTKKYLGAGGVFTVQLPPGTQRVRVYVPKSRAYEATTSPVLVVRR